MDVIKRKGYPSAAQKARLVQLVEADEGLRSGKFSTAFTKKVAESKWATIANDLNSLVGAKKSWSEWRKTWQDMRTKAKKRQSEIRRAQNQTGGGGPPDPLSDQNAIILSTISEASLIGHNDSKESVVIFKDLKVLPITPRAATMTAPDDAIIVDAVVDGLCTEPKDFRQQNAASTVHTTVTAPDDAITIIVPPQAETETSPAAALETTLAAAPGGSRINESVNPVTIDRQNAPKEKQGKKRKLLAQKRLETTNQTAIALKNALEEKNNYKKVFYESYIIEMRRQTDALLSIANNLHRA